MADVVLTDREAEIMDVLWKNGPSLVADVRDRLPEQFAYTTVLSVLRTLEAKGYVDHETEGKGHRYFPTVQQRAARRTALRHLASKLFDGSHELLLTHLIDDKQLGTAELQKLRELLNQPRRPKK